MPVETEWTGAQLRSVTDVAADIRLFEIEPSGDFVAPSAGCHINVMVFIDGRPECRPNEACQVHV